MKSAAGFTASIRLRLGEKEVDGKSILGVMQLGATGGTTIEIVADGDDAEVAPFKARFGDGLYSGFVGSPAQVSDYLNSLREYGIDRIQLTEMLKGSTLRLSGFWGA